MLNEYFYNFIQNGKNRGYSYLRFDHKTLLSDTRFLLQNQEIYTNIFLLKLDKGRILACKHGDADWVDFRNHPLNHYPSCAYPLLLSRVHSDPYTYIQISEEDGSTQGEMVLSWEGDDIVESRNGTEYRRFTMQNGVPIKIDWGGAVSYLCQSANEAIEGSGIDFVQRGG